MNDPLILAIETSGRSGSIAVAAGPKILAMRGLSPTQEHARDLLPGVDLACREAGAQPADIQHCYLSIGPGSFTGLRIAVTLARHLALACGTKACAVPSLDVVAANCLDLGEPPMNVAVIIDAKKDHVFASLFELQAGGYDCVRPPAMVSVQALLDQSPRPLKVIGEAGARFESQITAAGAIVGQRELWIGSAKNVARLGWAMAGRNEFTPARELVPLYVRRPEAEELWEKRQGHAMPAVGIPGIAKEN
jgi:tRNA threonylcarbamoyladenosine biosynthesis protein TsaB